MTIAPQRPEQSAPDWETIEHAVQCPLCDYNLRGLSERRCPECGFVFTWAEVLDPDRRNHPYLFEQHPQRNFDSFFRTLWGGLRPGRFWKTLHPAQRRNLFRLGIYGGIVLLAAIAPLVIGMLTLRPLRNANFGVWRANHAWQYLSIDTRMLFGPLFYLHVSRLLRAAVIGWTLLPILTYTLLMIFQASMQRVRVKMHHVVRCVVYSADVLVWPSAILSLLLILNLTVDFKLDELIAWLVIIFFPLVWILFTWRMMRAYRRYLRFHHAEMVVLSVQVMLGIGFLYMMLTHRF